MWDTTLFPSVDQCARLLQPIKEEGLCTATEASGASGGLYSTGADMAKPMGVDAIEDIKRVMREVGGPHMATLSQAAGLKRRSLDEIAVNQMSDAPFYLLDG